MRKRAIAVVGAFVGVGLIMTVLGILIGTDVISIIPSGQFGTLAGFETSYIGGSVAAYLTVPGLILFLFGIGIWRVIKRYKTEMR